MKIITIIDIDGKKYEQKLEFKDKEEALRLYPAIIEAATKRILND